MTIWICRWQINTLVTSWYQPKLSSIAKIFSRRISQSDWNIQMKLNYIKMTREFILFSEYFSADNFICFSKMHGINIVTGRNKCWSNIFFQKISKTSRPLWNGFSSGIFDCNSFFRRVLLNVELVSNCLSLDSYKLHMLASLNTTPHVRPRCVSTTLVTNSAKTI